MAIILVNVTEISLKTFSILICSLTSHQARKATIGSSVNTEFLRFYCQSQSLLGVLKVKNGGKAQQMISEIRIYTTVKQ